MDVIEFAQMARALNCDAVALLQELIRSRGGFRLLAATENTTLPIKPQLNLKS